MPYVSSLAATVFFLLCCHRSLFSGSGFKCLTYCVIMYRLSIVKLWKFCISLLNPVSASIFLSAPGDSVLVLSWNIRDPIRGWLLAPSVPSSLAIIDNLLLLTSLHLRWARQCNMNSPCMILFNSHKSPEWLTLLLSPFYRKRNWGWESRILAMLCLLNSLEALNFLKNLFSHRGTKISIQLESLPLREGGFSLFLCFSLPPFPISIVLKNLCL